MRSGAFEGEKEEIVDEGHLEAATEERSVGAAELRHDARNRF